MRPIFHCLLFCLLAASAAASALDEPISVVTLKGAIERLKAVEARLSDDDALLLRVGFERLDIEVVRRTTNELPEEERQRLFVSVIDGLTPRKIILLGCMAFVRQTREALRNATDDELPHRRFDVKHAEDLLYQAVQKYAPPRPEAKGRAAETDVQQSKGTEPP